MCLNTTKCNKGCQALRQRPLFVMTLTNQNFRLLLQIPPPVLIKTKIPRFHLTQGSSTPNNLNVGTMSVPRKNPCPTPKVCKRGYLVLLRKRLEPRVLPWQQYSRCHFVSFVMYISGAKFEEHCSNISGDIVNSVFYRFSGTIYDVINFLICILQKCEYL